MLPTQLMKNHAAEIRGAELDQLLIVLYQACRDRNDGQGQRRFHEMPPEERLGLFRNWLERLMEQDNPDQDNLKVQRIFRREMPELRRAWAEIMLPGGETDRE